MSMNTNANDFFIVIPVLLIIGSATKKRDYNTFFGIYLPGEASCVSVGT